MTATVTTWTLANPDGASSRCVVQSSGEGGYDVIVWSGDSIVLWERVAAQPDARSRADEYWTFLVANGREPVNATDDGEVQVGPEPYRRACPECQQPTGVITHRRNTFLVLGCEACGHRWNARARVAAHDRRTAPRGQVDRRRAA